MEAWPKPRIRMLTAFAGGFGVLLAAMVGGASGRPWVALAVGVGVGVGYFWFGSRKYRRRRRVLSEPFPAAWRKMLGERVEFYRNLDARGRERFENDVRIFLAEQRIYGLRNAPVSDEARVLVAAAAATMSHGLPGWEWPNMRDIVIYPRRFDEDYRQDVDADILGMVHLQGPFLISERDLKHGFARPHDGQNVALHELAHVMDMATGYADGVPAGLAWVANAPWVEAIARRLKRMRGRRRAEVLRRYAATNEAEFFAVAVEVFFEQPSRLKARDPELYELLVGYFGQDPATGSGALASADEHA